VTTEFESSRAYMQAKDSAEELAPSNPECYEGFTRAVMDLCKAREDSGNG